MNATVLGLVRSFGVTLAVILALALGWCAWRGTWATTSVEDAVGTSALVVGGVAGLVAVGDLKGRGFHIQYAQTASRVPGERRAALAHADLLSAWSFAGRVLLWAALVVIAVIVARFG